MKSKKVLHIEEAFFNLPDDFDGTTDDALKLMAYRIIESEPRNSECQINSDLYKYLKNKASIKGIASCKIYDTY